MHSRQYKLFSNCFKNQAPYAYSAVCDLLEACDISEGGLEDLGSVELRWELSQCGLHIMALQRKIRRKK